MDSGELSWIRDGSVWSCRTLPDTNSVVAIHVAVPMIIAVPVVVIMAVVASVAIIVDLDAVILTT